MLDAAITAVMGIVIVAAHCGAVRSVPMEERRRAEPPRLSRRSTLALAATAAGAVWLGGLPAARVSSDARAQDLKEEPVAKRVRPKVVAFDVIETLFDLAPIGKRLEVAGLKESLLPVWFARMLRDAFALEVSGAFKPFPEVAAGALKVLMDEHGVKPDDGKVKEVLAGFAELPAHPDVRPAFERLKEAGVRAVTLTNGTAETTKEMLDGAGLTGLVERSIAIDEVKHWKPAKEVYLHAAKVTNVATDELALVAAHAWDTHGAGRAGLTTGWVGRKGKLFPPAMDAPHVRGETLVDVVTKLLSLPQ